MKKTIILQDPTSFSVYDLKLNGVKRRIVLIGEIHEIVDCKPAIEKNTQYMLIPNFIEKYHNSIGDDKILDIFSESFYIRDKKLGWLSTFYHLVRLSTYTDDTRALSYIRKRLDTCSPKYNFSFYKCPENLRVHLCDVRFIKEMDYSFKHRNKMECFANKLFKIGLSYINPKKIPRANIALSSLVSFVYKFLFDPESPQHHTKLSEYIISETKTYKQIKNIPSKSVRCKLTKWSNNSYDYSIKNAQKKFIQFEKMYGGEMKNSSLIGYASGGCIGSFIQNISLQILYVISVFMDLYLSARLLRDFSDSSYAKNAIIYVGEYHAKQYKTLMKILGAKEIFHKNSIKGTIYSSCVDISGFYNKYMV